MSYKGPALIKEPELRWPIVMVAFLITAFIALLAAGIHYVAMQPRTMNHGPEPRLVEALQPGQPEFDQFSPHIVVEQLMGTEKVHPFNNLAVEMKATVRNRTGRTVTGLEISGAILDGQKSTLRERTMVVIPTRQAVLEPDEAINVRILLENVDRDSERAELMLKVTGMRFS